VLAKPSRLRGLSATLAPGVKATLREKSFRRDTKTNTRDAFATRNVRMTLRVTFASTLLIICA
jgi:hypothetical protein